MCFSVVCGQECAFSLIYRADGSWKGLHTLENSRNGAKGKGKRETLKKALKCLVSGIKEG